MPDHDAKAPEGRAPDDSPIASESGGMLQAARLQRAVERRKSRAGGAALPAPQKAKFESKLGRDLGDVRVHTGADAEADAEAVDARAYTVGKDIHFNRGQYDPGSAEGEKLLAHEVAHTTQPGGVARRKPKDNAPDAAGTDHGAEAEADSKAASMTDGNSPAFVKSEPMGKGDSGTLWGDSHKPPGGIPKLDTAAALSGTIESRCPAIKEPGPASEVDVGGLGAAYTKVQQAKQELDTLREALFGKSKADAKAKDQAIVTFQSAVAYLKTAGDAFGQQELAARTKMLQSGFASPVIVNSAERTAVAELDVVAGEVKRAVGDADTEGQQAGKDLSTVTKNKAGFYYPWPTDGPATVQNIDGWFQFFGVTPPPTTTPSTDLNQEKCMFDGAETTREEVIRKLMDDAKAAGCPVSESVVSDRYAHLFTNVSSPNKEGGNLPPQLALQIQGNWTKAGGNKALGPDNVQVTAAFTLRDHGDKKSGFEFSFQVSGTMQKAEDGQIRMQNVQASGQAAWVWAQVAEHIDFQAYIQGSAGLQKDDGHIAGQLVLPQNAMVQIATGVQATYEIPGTGGHLSLFSQTQVAETTTGAGKVGEPGAQQSFGYQVSW